MPISRRRFLSNAALFAGSAAASWAGWRWLNPRPPVRVRYAGLPAGHDVRDGTFQAAPQSEHRCNTLILGSGAAALSAAWYLARHGVRDFLLAEGFERNGNNAAYRHGALAAPSGAHYLAQPSRESAAVRLMLDDFGMVAGQSAAGEPLYRDEDLVSQPDERLLLNGRWQSSLLPAQDKDSRRFFALTAQLAQQYGSDGRKLFAIPVSESSADSRWRSLDSQTFAQWLAAQGYRSPALLWYLDYCCRDDYGQGIAAVSAFAGLHYFAARGHSGHTPVLTWPQGLEKLSQCLREKAGLQTLARLPEAREWTFARPASCDVSALSVAEDADGVAVLLRHNTSGRQTLVRARRVLCAMPLMAAARIIAAPQRYGFAGNRFQAAYAPWLVANFALAGFPAERGGSEMAWDNVVHGSRGLGFVCATNQFIRRAPPERTLLTAYTALDMGDPQSVRRRLLAASADDLLAEAAQDLLAAYGRGFWRRVEAVDICVRGHGMRVPLPGYLDDAPTLALRRHRSRLIFAHSDLSGYSVFEEAAHWGVAAAQYWLSQDQAGFQSA